MKNLKPNEIYAVSAMTIDNNTEGVKTLITKYGVILPKNASRADVDKAFAALLRKSKSFRNDFALLAANESQKSDNFSNFMEFLGNAPAIQIKIARASFNMGKLLAMLPHI